MRLGMPALIEFSSARENAALCRELGLDFIELNANLPMYQHLNAEEYRALRQEYGVRFTVHLDDNMDVADLNPRVAGAYLDTVLETVEEAKQAGVFLINMHLSRGVYFTLPHKKVYLIEEYRQQYLNRMAVFRDACERAIGDSSLRIAVENTGGFLPVQQEALALLLKSPVFCLNYDVGHHACAGSEDEAFILTHREKLSHMHLHDAQPGRGKDHLTLGTGVLDIPGLLSLMKGEKDTSVVIEVKTEQALRASVQWMKEHGLTH